jgi:O-antigen ligase
MGRKIRVNNYSTMESEELHPPSDRVFYSAIFGGVFAFFIITYPYREVYIPTIVLAAIGLFGMGLLTFLAWSRPQEYWASIAFVIYIPFSGEYAGDFNEMLTGFNLTNIIMIPIFVQWVMQRSHMGEPLLRFHKADIPILMFCVLSSMSLFQVGISQGESNFISELVRLKRWLTPFAVYFLFVNMARNERGVRYLVITICTALTAIAILTMKESYDIGPGGTWDRIRVKGVLGQSNATGAFFVYYTLIFLCFFLSYWRERRAWLLLIPFLLCGRALTLANSRGGMIAFTLATLLTLFIKSKRLFLVGILMIYLGLQFPEYLPETISGRLIYGTFKPMVSGREKAKSEEDEIVFPGEQESGFITEQKEIVANMDASAQGRMAIWKAGYQLFLEKPWFGHGYGEFPRQVGRYNSWAGMRDPHSTYLGVAAEMGIFALIALIGIILFILRASLHVYRRGRDEFMRAVGLAGAGMVMGVASANFFGSQFDTTELTAYFWVLSAIIVQYSSEIRAQDKAVARPHDRLMVDPWREEEEEEEEETIRMFHAN